MGSKLKAVLTVAGIGAVSLGLGQIFINLDKKRIQGSFLKTALALMREEPEVKNLLGEKLTIGSRRALSDDFTKREPKRIQLMLPVSGEKDNGYLFAYARRKTEEEKFKLYKIEMTFNKIKNRKLVLLDLGEHTDATYTHETGEQDRKKAKAREELFAKLDAEMGQVSPTKEFRKRLENEKSKNDSPSQPAADRSM